MNWFKGTNRNQKTVGSSSATDPQGDLSKDSDPSAETANPTQPTVAVKPLDETQAWLKTLEPKANPKFVALKRQLHQKVISNLDIGSMARWDPSKLRVEVRRQAESICGSADLAGLDVTHSTLIDEVMDEVFGLGPLEALRADPLVSDIMINGPKMIYVERQGRLFRTPIIFHDDEHLVP